MNYNNLVISDDRFDRIHGQPALAGYRLRMGITFSITNGSPQHVGVEIVNLRATVRCKGPATSHLHVGTALPEVPVRLRCMPHPYPHTVLFDLDLSPLQLAAMERARAGGELTFAVTLIGEGLRGEDRSPCLQELSHTSNLSEWGRVLKEFGFADMIVFGIPVPQGVNSGPLKAAGDRLNRARADFLHGRWEEVVAKCRLVIEGVWEAQALQEPAANAVKKYTSGERKKMTRAERALFIQEALRHFAHPAHHVGGDESDQGFSDTDAAFSLGLASACLAEAAARELA
jgi:hypothetical protein